jgi:hypothetical protein
LILNPSPKVNLYSARIGSLRERFPEAKWIQARFDRVEYYSASFER